MDKNKGEARDIVFGVLSLVFAAASMLGFGAAFVVDLVRTGSVGLSQIAPAFLNLLYGSVCGGTWITAGVKSLKKVGMYKKLRRVLANTPRFRLPALANALKKDAQVLHTDLNRMLKTGYFKNAVIDTESKEIIFDKNSEMLPVPAGENDTIYKPHIKLPTFPLFMGIATGAVFGLGTSFGLIGGCITGVIAFLLGYARFPSSVYYTEAIRVMPKIKPQKLGTKTGNEELDKQLPAIYNHNAELIRLSFVLSTPKIKDSLTEITRLLDEIIKHLTESPDKIKQLRQFTNYYLPTTVKLLQSYEEFAKERHKGENIRSSMLKIEGMMSKIVAIFNREHDDLYNDKAMDISAEVAVMQSMIDEI